MQLCFGSRVQRAYRFVQNPAHQTRKHQQSSVVPVTTGMWTRLKRLGVCWRTWGHHFALENRVQMWQVRREKCERFQETRAHYRDYGSGWVIFGRTTSGKGLHGARNRAAYQQFIAIAHRASSARCKNLSSPLISPLRRSFRQRDSESYYCRCSANGIVSPRRTKPRWPKFRDSRIDLRRSGNGDASITRNSALAAAAVAILSCFEF